jgi:hypothetical protein
MDTAVAKTIKLMKGHSRRAWKASDLEPVAKRVLKQQLKEKLSALPARKHACPPEDLEPCADFRSLSVLYTEQRLLQSSRRHCWRGLAASCQ